MPSGADTAYRGIIPSLHGPFFGLEGAAHGARVGKTPSQPRRGEACGICTRNIWSPGHDRQSRKISSSNVDSIMYVISRLTVQAKPTYPWPTAGATNEISEGTYPPGVSIAPVMPLASSNPASPSSDIPVQVLRGKCCLIPYSSWLCVQHPLLTKTEKDDKQNPINKPVHRDQSVNDRIYDAVLSDPV